MKSYVERHFRGRRLVGDESERTCSCGFTFNTRALMLTHVSQYNMEARREHHDPSNPPPRTPA